MRAALLVLLTLSGISAHGSVDAELLEEIANNPHWSRDYIDTCSGDKTGVPDMYCHIYRIYLFTVRVEVRSLDPLLIVLKEFIPTDYADQFLIELNTAQMEIQKTVDSSTGKSVPSPGRNANGTFVNHNWSETSTKIFNHIQQRFPSIEFRSAVKFQILSYNAGGHYAPHWDYLLYDSEEIANQSSWYRKGGNRLMTFLFVLRTATAGGGTVFPRIKTLVQPQKGDAIVWLNMDAEQGRLDMSLHGACPIWDGTKTAETLWVRVRGNELLLPCSAQDQNKYDLDKLIRPTEKQLQYKREWRCDYGSHGCSAGY